MRLLSGVGEIPFHSILMSCWVIKRSVPPNTSLEVLLVITTLRAWGQCHSHSPYSAADNPSSSNPPALPPSNTLFSRSNNYSFGDNIALRQLLADVTVPTSGQCYQNPGGPDRPGATGSRNVKVEGFFSPRLMRGAESEEKGEKETAKNKIKIR